MSIMQYSLLKEIDGTNVTIIASSHGTCTTNAVMTYAKSAATSQRKIGTYFLYGMKISRTMQRIAIPSTKGTGLSPRRSCIAAPIAPRSAPIFNVFATSSSDTTL
jgi:hypothetical protein